MSKFIINTKSATYSKDKENFIKELKQFHETKGAPPFRIPVLNGKEIDLYLFHLMIFQKGGWAKITNHGALEQLIRALQLPLNCLNIEALLKCIYIRYLERYERSKNTQGRDDDYSVDVEDDYRRSRGLMRPVQTYTSAENHSSRNLPRVAGPSERLALSLLSPLPNEQDFAINVCTVLAAEAANRLPLASTPHILDFLLAHAGVYNHPTLREIVGRCYRDTRDVSPDNFWIIRGGGGGALELSDESRWLTSNPELSVQAMASQITLGDKLVEALQSDDYVGKKITEILLERDKLSDEWWLPAPSDEDTLFACRMEGGARDVITQRILQVAAIARNISFHEENVPFLARHQTFLRFLLLACNCWMGGLKQSAMDTLGNVAQEIVVKDPSTCLLTRHLFSSILAALQSDDRARIVSALEILNKLAQNELNEDILLKCLEQKIYHQVCSFLTINDIMLLVATLECVYALTSLGERACEFVVRVKGLVDTLVSLITVEAQSYGPKACILMRVVETVAGLNPAGMTTTVQPTLPPPAEHHPHTPVKGSRNASPAPAAPQVHVHTIEKQQNSQQQVPTSQPQQTPSTPVRSQDDSNTTVTSTPNIVSTANTKTTTVESKSSLSMQQQHAHQQAIQENEQFALMWLRNCWEPCPAPTPSTIEAAELYRQYLACCSKVGRKGVIAPLHFPRCVRSVFGGMIGPNNIKLPSGELQQHYVGIKVRASASAMMVKTTPPQIVKPPGPSSPILKAQLSKLEMTKQQQPSAHHPHLSQALTEAQTSSVATASQTPSAAVAVATPAVNPAPPAAAAAANNTSMIKHLLAHKVEPTIVRNQQVAQRQNQQRLLGQQVNTVQAPPQRISPTNLEDPEALISCSTITSTGVTSTSPLPPTQSIKGSPHVMPTITVNSQLEDSLDGLKKEHTEEQIPHNNSTQQNKMLADLLEKKSTPPMTNIQSQLPVVLNTFTVQEPALLKDATSDGEVKIVNHIEIEEPPIKKMKAESDRPQEIVSTTAANLYAALAASALEDEEDLLLSQQSAHIQNTATQIQQVRGQPTSVVQQSNFPLQQSNLHIQQPLIQSQQQNIHIQQAQASAIQVHQSNAQKNMQVQQTNVIKQTGTPMQQQVQLQQQVQQAGMQLQQQMQQGGMQMQQVQQPGNIQIQQVQVQQQPMQVMQVQQPTLQVQPGSMQMQVQQIQQALQQQPIQVQIQQPTMQMQVQQSNVQVQQLQDMQLQQIAGPSGQIILQEKQVISTPQYISQQPVQIIATPNTQQSNLGYIPGGVVPHKTIIILQGSAHNTPITLTNPTNVIQTQQRIIQTTPTVIQGQPTIVTSQTMMQPQNIIQTTGVIKQQIIQGQNALANNQKPVISHQPQPQKPQQQVIMTNQSIVSNNQQIIVSQAQPQMVMSGQTTTQSQQVITVDGKQLVVNRQMNQPISQQAAQSRPAQPAQTSSQTMLQNQINQNIQQNVLPPGRPVLNKQQTVIGIQKMPADKMTQPVSVIKNEPKIEAQPTKTEVPSTPQPDNPWVCQWRNCNRPFETAGAVFAHAARAHCPPVQPPSAPAVDCPCLWYGCDKMPRKRFALMTHLQDRHCTAEALRSAHAARRRTTAQPITQVNQSTTPNDADSDSPSSVGYAPNAALHALNRHAVDFLNPRELMDDNEGPVTKSIRLTAALILRNIVIYSNNGRRQLRSYEPHLASIALSSVEASRTVAQILYDMNNI